MHQLVWFRFVVWHLYKFLRGESILKSIGRLRLDNFYVKQHLGLTGFRMRSFEATEKWLSPVFPVYIFLQYRLNHAQPHEHFRSIAAMIRLYRQEHTQILLETNLKIEHG